MKATELMIGDWVCCTFWSEPKNYQVEELKHCADNELKVVVRDIGNLIFPEKYIEPIPLTPEILEKNGFEKVYDEYKLPNYRIKWKSYTNLFFTVFTGVDGYWNHVGLGVIIGGVPATLDYVHQLQHALRLCGIDKEIIL